MRTRLPDFVIIGAQKAASTLLLNSLRDHPEAWLPAHEEPYFRDPVFTPDGFPAFARPYAYRTETRLGLKCPDYLGRPEVPRRLAGLLDTPDLVVCLRDPVARAVSAYFWKVRWGLLPLLPVDEGMRRLLDGGLRDHDGSAGDVLEWGRYGAHLSRYLEVFPREKLMILVDEDLRRAPDVTLDAVARHLGITERGVGEVSRRGANEGVYSRSRLRFLRLRTPLVLRWDAQRTYASIPKPHRLAPRLANAAVGALDSKVLSRVCDNTRPALSPEVDAELRAFYRDDVAVVEELLGRDLDWGPTARRHPVGP
ncbi:sulfotransferase domain-containing protein [Actinomycetospora aeridis]|uniref:Sulfotransferase domain-containing protein n=1 Tax=Actinomycetospora aeridis TaxID=3129231 RepID=A0ABU8N7M5_9PSEU